jgi:hypothetical protein
MVDIEAKLEELALLEGLVQEPLNLLLGLSPNSYEYWRNTMFWNSLRDIGAMISPQQVMEDLPLESDPKILTQWLDWNDTHIRFLDQVLICQAFSSGLDLLQQAHHYHVKTIYAETLTYLQS